MLLYQTLGFAYLWPCSEQSFVFPQSLLMFFVNEISDNPDQPTVEHFQMLRRQWASKAQLLMATLDELPDADTTAVQGK